MLQPVNNSADVQVHLVTPHSFNDAQEVADRFKRSVPVILNLQATEGELAKRLIGFASGLTYALEAECEDRREDLPADSAQRRGVGRGEGPPRRKGLLQPVLNTPGSCSAPARNSGQRLLRSRSNTLPADVAAVFPSAPASAPPGSEYPPTTLPWMRIGFAGAGNMATAIARGWASSEGGPEAMLFSDAGSGRAARLAAETGGRRSIRCATSPAAPTPWSSHEARRAGDRRRDARGRGRAGGVGAQATSVAQLRRLFGDVPVVRTMPMVAVELQSGVVCHAPIDAELDGTAGARLLDLFDEIGHLVEVRDEVMDVATALMACARLSGRRRSEPRRGRRGGRSTRSRPTTSCWTRSPARSTSCAAYDPIECAAPWRLPAAAPSGPGGARRRRARPDAFREAVAASLRRMRG